MIERILHSQFDDGERFFLVCCLPTGLQKNSLLFSRPFINFTSDNSTHTTNINQSEIKKKRTTTTTRFTQEDRLCYISDEEIAGINSGCQLFGIVWGWRENQKQKTKNPSVDFDFSADTFHFIPALQLS